MRPEELLCGDELSHSVSAPIGLDVAILVDGGAPFHVFASVSAPLRHVRSHEVVAVTEVEERLLAVVQLAQLPAMVCRQHCALWR